MASAERTYSLWPVNLAILRIHVPLISKPVGWWVKGGGGRRARTSKRYNSPRVHISLSPVMSGWRCLRC